MKRLFLDTSCNDSIGVSCFIITENENILFA